MTGFLLLIALVKEILGLRLVRIDVPTAVILGNPFWLNCTYNLEGDYLYSVKWYKNSIEFYRYLPSDYPPAQKYNLKGVNIDLSKSSFGNIYLNSSTLNTEGNYRCEVSTEAPSFQTVREEKGLTVYVLPQEGPLISGTLPQYVTGNVVNTTCISGPSKPTASLKWYINGKRADHRWERHLEPIRQSEKLEGSVLMLTFEVRPDHFANGVMKLRCTAVISEAYSMSSEEIIVGDSGISNGVQYNEDVDGPTITGGLPRYEVNHMVNVNCTASKSKPPAELKWYLNDQPAPVEHYVYYSPLVYKDDQKASVLGLRFKVLQRHFDNSEMRLKCTATLSKVLNMSNQQTVVGSSQQSSLLHIYEKMGPTTNGGARTVQNSASTMMKLMVSLTLLSLTHSPPVVTY